MYKEVKKAFSSYILKIEQEVDDTNVLNAMQKQAASYLQDKYKDKIEIELYKIDYKNKIKGKTEHIYRVTDGMEGMFQELNLGEDYVDVAKVVGLLHDIGRYKQLEKTSTFVDGDSYSNKYPAFLKYKNHAEHGADLLAHGLFTEFNININYQELIYLAVRNHAYKNLPSNLSFRLNEDAFQGKQIGIVLKEEKETVNSLYAQAIVDVDKFDLFNQVLIGNIPIVRKDFGLDFLEGDTVEEFATIWGMSSKLLREYNKIPNNKQMKDHSIIRIPTKFVPIEKFILPGDLVEDFKNDTLAPLKDLQARKDYSFLCAQVFRLSLLRNIHFISMLKDINNKEVLKRTFDLYPDSFKEIMKPVFDYTQMVLIDQAIEESDSKIYTKQKEMKNL